MRYSLSTICSAVSLLCGIFGVAAAMQNATERTIRANDPVRTTYPVMITSIAVGGKSVECGLFVKPPSVIQPITPFQAGDDWLQQMTISLFNRTEKEIVAGTVSLMVLDLTTNCHTQVCPMEQIQLGQIPKVDAYDGRTGLPLQDHSERQPIQWLPGQTLTIRVGDYLEDMKSKLSNYEPITAVRNIAVHLGSFYFPSGMKWFGGYAVPDPTHPGKFRYLPDNYFPGRRADNWPPGYDR